MLAAQPAPNQSPLAEDLRKLIAAIAREPGVIARCACGAARFCTMTTEGSDAYEEFYRLHDGCRTPA